MPIENSRFLNLQNNTYTSGTSANVNVTQPHIAVNNNQGGQNYASKSANNFLPSVATPIVSTLVT
jgi:hypothetical protein